MTTMFMTINIIAVRRAPTTMAMIQDMMGLIGCHITLDMTRGLMVLIVVVMMMVTMEPTEALTTLGIKMTIRLM